MKKKKKRGKKCVIIRRKKHFTYRSKTVTRSRLKSKNKIKPIERSERYFGWAIRFGWFDSCGFEFKTFALLGNRRQLKADFYFYFFFPHFPGESRLRLVFFFKIGSTHLLVIVLRYLVFDNCIRPVKKLILNSSFLGHFARYSAKNNQM